MKLVKGAVIFIRETLEQISHISWPTFSEIVRYLFAVLLLSVIIAAYIYVLDELFTKLQLTWINGA